MHLTKNEEDYLKALFYLIIENEQKQAGTNQLAEYLGVSPASTSSMLKKLKTKNFVEYEKYGKLKLTDDGKQIAVRMMRKHRLWETFLYNHMNFNWEEVHEVAEQLEHIRSKKLIDELDKFLGHPKKDPHGATIPTSTGEYHPSPKMTLAMVSKESKCRLEGVRDGSAAFLKFVTEIGLALSSEIQIREIREFDGSIVIGFGGKVETVSRKFAENVFVKPIDA